MKKILIVLLLLASASLTYAQSGKGQLSEEDKKELMAKMEEYRAKLNLTEDQQQKVEKINEEFFTDLSTLKSSSGSKLSKYKKFKEARNKKDKKMKEVLSAEQYSSYQKMQSEMKKELKEKRKS